MFIKYANTYYRSGLRKTLRCFSMSSAQGSGPLSGVRVLDLTRIVAGPYCSMILGDLGADVLKVERLKTGDESRKWGPPFMKNSNDSCYFMANNRNKRSICIDLKSPMGKKIIYELAEQSDVLVENYVPGKLDAMKLGYNDLKNINVKLIYCSITGYGSKGPYANRPGYDVIAASLGGLLHITGPKDGEPCKVGVAMTDIATGLYAHGAILAALLQRSKTGRGQKIDCNLLSTQVSTLINIGSNYLNAGLEAQKWGTAHESIVPYESFPTKTGYITVGAGSDEQFKFLCGKLSAEHLSNDKNFSTNALRVKNRKSLIQALRKIFILKSTEDWLQILEGATFPYAPINSLREVFNNEHIKAIGIVKDVPTLRLRLTKPKHRKSVQWTETTIDNENMNKKKSKCCCIYVKPRVFDDLNDDDDDDDDDEDDDDDDECENCHGHVEKRKHVHVHEEGDKPVEDTGEGTSTQDENDLKETSENSQNEKKVEFKNFPPII